MAHTCASTGRRTLALALFLALASPLFADVIFLVDGRILIGTLIGPDSGGVAYSVSGGRTVIPVERILRTEKSVASLAELPLNVLLKDGSTIHGTVVDYDDDIGLFVDIGFGVLTIPVAAIAEMVDPVTRMRYAGAGMQARLGGGAYLPLGTDHFGPSWTGSAAAVFSIPGVRGLSAGIALGISGADYLAQDDVEYSFLSFGPAAEYRFLGWRMRDGFLSALTPLASVQAGACFISLVDPGAYPPRQGSMTGFMELAAGLDYALKGGLVLRLDLFGGMVFQSQSPFTTAGIRLHACYEL